MNAQERAVMQMALDAIESGNTLKLTRAVVNLTAALVLPDAEQEHVAIVNGAARNDIEWVHGRIPLDGTLLYAAPPPAPVERKPLTEIDWPAVGRIIDVNSRLRGQHTAGTSNWGAAIWKAAHGIEAKP